MIQLNSKIVPNPQILKWAQWFSPYKFQVKHLKGKDNILADFLSRPEEFSKRFSPTKSKPKQELISHIFMLSGASALKSTDHPHWEKVREAAKEYHMPYEVIQEKITEGISGLRLLGKRFSEGISRLRFFADSMIPYYVTNASN